MRSLLRFLLTFISSIVIASCILCIIFPSDADLGADPDSNLDTGGPGGWFSFRDPASLFSPTATISLTDDNSTFFNAKPAAFGPSLPAKGLSGQVWVGSGFGDDNINRRGMAATVEGELGCGDIPGWTDRHRKTRLSHQVGWPHALKVSSSSLDKNDGTFVDKARRDVASGHNSHEAISSSSIVSTNDEDGTDDELHYPFMRTNIAHPRHDRTGALGSKSHIIEHADIQSIRETAEIAGKVVLLSRGGCGFSEKIKWAQRRGAVAVIVADNVRGGPLVRMYARGDVSNITIPSLFTSHTTAHLLSHLIPPTVDVEKPGPSNEPRLHMGSDRPEEDAEKTVADDFAFPSQDDMSANERQSESLGRQDDADSGDSSNRWFSALRFSKSASRGKTEASANNKKWLKVKDFDETEAWHTYRKTPKKAAVHASDGFVIGVQDWRDPDVVQMVEDDDYRTRASQPVSYESVPAPSATGKSTHFKGGSITPGSGEYEQPGDRLVESKFAYQALVEKTQPSHGDTDYAPRRGWISHLLWRSPKSHDVGMFGSVKTSSAAASDPGSRSLGREARYQKDQPVEEMDHRTGLWVTLTPTDMNASPVLNTLFVLVVSPLITLALVYSMLLLRSRIRRRRWRAPKSIVERLPVRTYHALSSRTSPSQTPGLVACTSATPLLATAHPVDVNGISSSCATALAGSTHSSQYGSLEQSSLEQEKVISGLAEWRRKYGGKQRECVVCLEEYVDGVSRVMSLPCGHEFHVDCITPWLTTRRRTCPICKADVVRSLTQGSPRTAPVLAVSEDDVQRLVAERRNTSPSASLPVPQSMENDVERAEDYASSYSDAGSPSSWFSRNLSRGLDYLGVQHDRRQAPLDRNR